MNIGKLRDLSNWGVMISSLDQTDDQWRPKISTSTYAKLVDLCKTMQIYTVWASTFMHIYTVWLTPSKIKNLDE